MTEAVISLSQKSELMSTAFTTTNDTRLTAIFPRQPKLAGTRMSPFWILLELRMMEVVVTTGAVRCAELQSNCHHQQTNSNTLFTGWMPFLSPNQQ